MSKATKTTRPAPKSPGYKESPVKKAIVKKPVTTPSNRSTVMALLKQTPAKMPESVADRCGECLHCRKPKWKQRCLNCRKPKGKKRCLSPMSPRETAL